MAQIPDNIIKILYDYTDSLSKEIKIKSLILFGSYARGDWKDDSDVDVAVFSDYFSDMEKTEATAFLLDKALPYDTDIQPIAFQEKDFDDYKENPFINEIVTTGIKII